MTKGKIVVIVITVLVIIYGIIYSTRPSFTYRNTQLPDTFQDFYINKLKISNEKNAKPKNPFINGIAKGLSIVIYENIATIVSIIYIFVLCFLIHGPA